MKKYKLLIIFLLLAFVSISMPRSAYADRAQDFCDDQFPVTNSTSAGENASCVNSARSAEAECFRTNGTGGTGVQCVENYYNGLRGTTTPAIEDTPIQTDCEPPAGVELSAENCGIISILVATINFLSAAAVLAIITSIIFAGYLYMTARDNAGQIQQAKQRITWAIVALFLFIFSYAFLNWLVPGGVLP